MVTLTAQKYPRKCYWSSPVQNNVQFVLIIVILGWRNLGDFPFHGISWPLYNEHFSIIGLPIWFIKSLVLFGGLDLMPASHLLVCLITGNLQSAYVYPFSLNANFLPREGAQKCPIKNLYANLLTCIRKFWKNTYRIRNVTHLCSSGRRCRCRWGQEREGDFPWEWITYSKWIKNKFKIDLFKLYQWHTIVF